LNGDGMSGSYGVMYYFDLARKELICKYCGRGFKDYLMLNDHFKERHYQIITPERVIE
jgi:hypothetical protein